MVPTENCIKNKDLTLLYVGISPSEPPINGKPPSKQNLYKRIRKHYNGNSYGSTLRLSLGCLLAQTLEIELKKVGKGNRVTFTKDGEQKLSNWMNENAFVSWVEEPQPWVLEKEALKNIPLPLNIRDNPLNEFSPILSKLRSDMKKRAY